MKPDFSIVVPIYNVDKKVLCECIDTLLNQSLSNIEIILVNDGSTNGIDKICDYYGNKDGRIVVIHKENTGVSASRNIGIKKAKAEWLLFVDPDDWIDLNLCKEIKEVNQKCDADILIFTHYSGVKGNEKSRLYGEKDILLFSKAEHDLLQLSILFGYNGYRPLEIGSIWGKLYRKEMLLKNNILFNEGLPRAQDRIFNLYAIEFAEKIAFFNKALYHYRFNNISVSRKYKPDTYLYLAKTINAAENFIEEYKKSVKFLKAYQVFTIINLFEALNLSVFNEQSKDRFLIKRKNYFSIIKLEPYKSAIKTIQYRMLDSKKNRFKLFFLKFNLFFPFYLWKKHKR